MHVSHSSINGSPNVGLYGYANAEFALIGETTSDSFEETVQDILDVPTIRLTVAGTNLVGAFITGNKSRLLIPDMIQDHEKERLLDLPVEIKTVHTNYTCLGNNILMNDDAAMVSPVFSDEEVEHVQSLTGLPTVQDSLAGIEAIGSLGVFNNALDRMVVTNEISEEDFQAVNDYFDVTGTTTSVNKGAAQVRCGVICNEHGFIVGDATGGPETTTIDKGLGFV